MHRTFLYWLIATLCAGGLQSSIAQTSGPQSKTAGPVNQLRSHSGKTADRATKNKLDFQKYGGLVYANGSSSEKEYELKLDVYVPEGDGPYPAILAVHGGGWTSGSKLHMLRHAWMMAARGYVVVAINYRHAPKYKFPCQIYDCKQAVRWMRHNANKYKIDPKRIGGFGYSAGGHLVSLLGTTDPQDGFEGAVAEEYKSYDTRLQAVAAGGAPCEFEWVGRRSLAYWIGAAKDKQPELYVAAAPATYIDSDDPPFYLYHGEGDRLVPLSTTKAMKDALCDANILCIREVVKNKGHFATFSDFDCLDRVLDFFDRHLKDDFKENIENRQ